MVFREMIYISHDTNTCRMCLCPATDQSGIPLLKSDLLLSAQRRFFIKPFVANLTNAASAVQNI